MFKSIPVKYKKRNTVTVFKASNSSLTQNLLPRVMSVDFHTFKQLDFNEKKQETQNTQ